MRLCVPVVLICLLLPAGKKEFTQELFKIACVRLCKCSALLSFCSLGPEVLHLLGGQPWRMQQDLGLS